MTSLQHVAQHHVTAVHAVLGMQAGVIVGGGLEHAHQHGGLLGGQVLWRGVEIGLACRLDAEGVRTEIHRVGIHCQNLLLTEVGFQFHGCDPLLGLHDEHLDTGDISQKTCRIFCTHTEEVLCQLLGDG